MADQAMAANSSSEGPTGSDNEPEAGGQENGGPAATGSALTPVPSRALVVAREVRERTMRERRRQRWLFAGIVAATVAGTLAWGALVMQPRYAAEMRFSVRGSSAATTSSTSPVTSMLASGSGASTAVGFVDGFAVNDFLKSRDGMLRLGKTMDLPKMLGVAPGTSTEALYRAYGDAVSVRFNMVEQENVVAVSAFSPGNSRRMAEGLMAEAQDFVQRMDAQGVQNTLDVDARQLQSAEEEAMKAAGAVADWRASNRNIDPEAEASMVMTMIGQIEQELNAARINYEKVRAFGNPDHPMLQPARAQVEALEGQLAQARARLAGGTNSQAARLRTYTQLKNAQTFADNALAAARDAYQAAYRETTRQRRYLSVIARPVASDEPTSPDLWVMAMEGLLGGVVLAFAASLGLSLVRTSRD